MAPLLKSADFTAPSYAFVQLWRPHCKPIKQLLVEECRLLQLTRVAALSAVSLNVRSRVLATDKRRSIPSQEAHAISIIFLTRSLVLVKCRQFSALEFARGSWEAFVLPLHYTCSLLIRRPKHSLG